jgi:sugar lactone lactonase YvrE
MIRHRAIPASAEIYVLAEGPIWDDVRQRLLWVDINGHRVLAGELRPGPEAKQVVETQRLTFEGTVGAVVCSEAGDLLLAGPRNLLVVRAGSPVAPDGSVATEAGPALIPDGKNSRLNDGGCDPRGRFLVGSLPLDDRQNDEQLLRIEPSGQVRLIDDHLGLSNGLAWSPDGTRFYSIDTVAGLIWQRDYDADTDEFGPRTVLRHIDDGSPDGMCVDAQGNLWVAIWGAGEVRCFSPTGEQLAVVTVAAPNTSCVAFVGPGLDTLLITTASEQLSSEQAELYPDSGRLFTATVGAVGVPVPYWSGPTPTLLENSGAPSCT